MRNLIAGGVGALLIASTLPAAAAGAAASGMSGVARGYTVTSELEPGRDGQFSASIEVRTLDSSQLVTRLHTRLAAGVSASFPLASHPGLEIRALAQDVGANSVRYVVEIFRLGVLEARSDSTVSLACVPAGN